MNNWKIVCDKVSTTMDLSEMEFEKGVATLILANLGWNEFRGNIKEQYHIEDHAKGYKPDFALFPSGKDEPGIFVELKETGHKQRSKDIKQIRTYMMLENCRFCIYFGEKMELFFIKIDGAKRSLNSVLTLDYNPKNPDGNILLDLINYDTFDEDKLLRFCEDRLAADEATTYFTSEEGRKRLFELMVMDRHLSDGAAKLLPSMLTIPERIAQGVEDISETEIPFSKPEDTKIVKPIIHTDIVSSFRDFAEKTVGKNTARNYIRHLKGGVSELYSKIIDEKTESIFCINNSCELSECIATLKSNDQFVAANKANRYFFSASLAKFLEFLESKEEKNKEKTAKSKRINKVELNLKQKRTQRPPFKFSMIGLKVGDEILFESRGWKVKVASDNTIDYNGEQFHLSTFCKKYLPDIMRNKSEAYQGPNYFSLNGRSLTDLRDEKEGFRNVFKNKRK